MDEKKQYDSSSYGSDNQPHTLDGADAAVDPFKPGELDEGASGLADNPDTGKSLAQIRKESEQRVKQKGQ